MRQQLLRLWQTQLPDPKRSIETHLKRSSKLLVDELKGVLARIAPGLSGDGHRGAAR